MASELTAAISGRRWISPAQRSHSPGPLRSRRRRPKGSPRSIPRPSFESTAGSRVIAANIVSSTVNEEPTAGPRRKLTPTSSCPSIATTTTTPANSTARPDVSIAVTIASSGSTPASSPAR